MLITLPSGAQVNLHCFLDQFQQGELARWKKAIETGKIEAN